MRIYVRLIALVGLWSLLAPQPVLATSAGGTTIVNDASATYKDAGNNAYQTTSNAIIATVAKVAGLVVSPKETAANPSSEAVGVGQPASRIFVISNTSNIPDAYTITSVASGSLAVTRVAFITPTGLMPVTIGSTVSPTVQPGATMSVKVELDTRSLTVGQTVPISIAAQTTVADVANGLQTDNGQEFIVGSSAPSLTGPSGPGSGIDKTVDKVRAMSGQPGVTVTYDILAMNSGGSPANNVVVSDTLPTGITPVAGSAKIGGVPAGGSATITGQTLSVLIGTLAPGAKLDLSFDALIPNSAVLGRTFVNTATITADGISKLVTLPASVLIGTSNIVYDGFSGESAPVAGATVTMVTDTGAPVAFSNTLPNALLPFATGATPMGSNPFVTGADGAYAFPLMASQIAAGGSRYYITIKAPNYLNRRILFEMTPDVDGFLYDVKATTADGQPLAQAGAFTLTQTSVSLSSVFGLFGNLPLFKAASINVTKTARVQVAQPGDRVDYAVNFSSALATPILQASIVDALPPGLAYAPGTGRIDGIAAEPAISQNILTWQIAELDPSIAHTLTYSTVVFPSVTPGTQLVNGVSVGGKTGGVQVSGSSSAAVTVIGGVFGDRRALTGRVFADTMHTGHFASGDRGLAGIRIFLEDGTYVITDHDGRFDFPGVRPGMHVLRIDETTLPATVRPFSDAPMNSNRSLKRLIHGILDESTLEDVEFALAPQ